MLELLDEMWTLGPRADDGHVAAKTFHSCGSSSRFERGETGPSAVTRGSLRLRPHGPRSFSARVHRAELDDCERLAVEPHPL